MAVFLSIVGVFSGADPRLMVVVWLSRSIRKNARRRREEFPLCWRLVEGRREQYFRWRKPDPRIGRLFCVF
tara:strand:- start:122 stop:334 length:213 start_codon:yes stop_codon:yes gene_type:complete